MVLQVQIPAGDLTDQTCFVEEKMPERPVDDELRGKIHWNVCKLLGGVWQELSSNDLMVKPLSGGLSNYLYTCSLPPDKDPVDGEPKCVLIRIFGSLLQQDALVMDSVIFALLAEKGLGPRLHGLFNGGRIEEYIPSHCLINDQLRRPDISENIAQLLSSFHCLNMPVSKGPNSIFDLLLRFEREAYTTQPLEGLDQSILTRLEAFQSSVDIKAEVDWLRSVLERVNSPVVFCHNDVQAGNLLRFNRPDGSFELKMIDFEFSCYGYRGFDLANHFCEWTLDNFYCKAPYFRYQPEKFPTREQQVEFFRVYRQSSSLFAEDSDEQMLQEVRYCTMLSHLLWSVWAALQARISSITFDFVEYAECRMKVYQSLRAELEHQQIEQFKRRGSVEQNSNDC